MAKMIESDVVFMAAKQVDPFASGNPYLLTLAGMTLRERRSIVRQVVLLCAAIDGLEPLDALELLAKIGLYNYLEE